MELAVITAEKISVMFVMALIGMICCRIGLISGHTNEKFSDILLLLVSPLLILPPTSRPLIRRSFTGF